MKNEFKSNYGKSFSFSSSLGNISQSAGISGREKDMKKSNSLLKKDLSATTALNCRTEKKIIKEKLLKNKQIISKDKRVYKPEKDFLVGRNRILSDCKRIRNKKIVKKSKNDNSNYKNRNKKVRKALGKKRRKRKKKKISATSRELLMNNILKPIKLSPQLAEVVEKREMSRPDVTKAIFSYARRNNLQNPNDRRLIICDDRLKRVFGFNRKFVHMFEIGKLLVPHFIYASNDQDNLSTGSRESLDCLDADFAVERRSNVEKAEAKVKLHKIKQESSLQRRKSVNNGVVDDSGDDKGNYSSRADDAEEQASESECNIFTSIGVSPVFSENDFRNSKVAPKKQKSNCCNSLANDTDQYKNFNCVQMNFSSARDVKRENEKKNYLETSNTYARKVKKAPEGHKCEEKENSSASLHVPFSAFSANAETGNYAKGTSVAKSKGVDDSGGNKNDFLILCGNQNSSHVEEQTLQKKKKIYCEEQEQVKPHEEERIQETGHTQNTCTEQGKKADDQKHKKSNAQSLTTENLSSYIDFVESKNRNFVNKPKLEIKEENEDDSNFLFVMKKEEHDTSIKNEKTVQNSKIETELDFFLDNINEVSCILHFNVGISKVVAKAYIEDKLNFRILCKQFFTFDYINSKESENNNNNEIGGHRLCSNFNKYKTAPQIFLKSAIETYRPINVYLKKERRPNHLDGSIINNINNNNDYVELVLCGTCQINDLIPHSYYIFILEAVKNERLTENASTFELGYVKLQPRHNVLDWTPSQVCDFIESLQIPNLRNNFDRFGVNGRSLVNLNEEDLFALGLKETEVSQSVLKAIRILTE